MRSRASAQRSTLTEESLRQEQGLQQLRAANQSLLRQLTVATAKRRELVQAVYDAALAAASTLSVPPAPRPARDTRRHTGETAIAVLSDWQMAKVTPSYNSAVCAARIARYAEKVAELTAIQRADHPVRECRVYLLGDLIEGELIFPGQAHRIDSSLYKQVLADGRQTLTALVRSLLASFERVHVVGVVGNHGAIGGGPFRKQYHPESNADAMLYETTRLVLKGDGGREREPRLTWAPNSVHGERLWYRVDRVGSKGFLLFHGDQVKGGFAGYPWYGFGKKIMGWRMGAVPEPFDYAISGHFHTPVRGLYGTIEHWGSGSTESDNTWAAEMLASMGRPTQWLLFCHPEHGVTAEYLVRLDR